MLREFLSLLVAHAAWSGLDYYLESRCRAQAERRDRTSIDRLLCDP